MAGTRVLLNSLLLLVAHAAILYLSVRPSLGLLPPLPSGPPPFSHSPPSLPPPSHSHQPVLEGRAFVLPRQSQSLLLSAYLSLDFHHSFKQRLRPGSATISIASSLTPSARSTRQPACLARTHHLLLLPPLLHPQHHRRNLNTHHSRTLSLLPQPFTPHYRSYSPVNPHHRNGSSYARHSPTHNTPTTYHNCPLYSCSCS